jgi:hypothetical protein
MLVVHAQCRVQKYWYCMQDAGCIEVDAEGNVEATMAGRIASFYYLQHETMHLLMNHMQPDMDFKSALKILSNCPEYDELPVRKSHP